MWCVYVKATYTEVVKIVILASLRQSNATGTMINFDNKFHT